MAHLAIQGHATRGNEVIELLKMLGGIDSGFFSGNEIDRFYYIEVDKSICLIDSVVEHLDFHKMTLEQFLKRFPYKVGNRVKNVYGACGKVYEMKWIDDEIQYRLDFGHHTSGWYGADELLHPNKEQKEETMETITIDDFKANTKEWLIDKLHGMLIGDAVKAVGNLYDELHKPQYPKTYGECSGVINKIARNLNECEDPETYMPELMYAYQKLRICRDAYWNIAGDWEPDWNNISDKHCIYVVGGEIWLKECQTRQCNLAFPTEEMRDAFYENFKELIEQCKELL